MASENFKDLIGIDEAGRGPLAGPVAVGVVKISAKKEEKIVQEFREIKDSKKLTADERERWLEKIREQHYRGNLEFSASTSGARVIDRLGIVLAVRVALARGLRKLDVSPKKSHLKLDGALHAPRKFTSQQTIPKGDETQTLIAMASIVAKVIRDRKMAGLDQKYPAYGFRKHKGYGTKFHREQIQYHGPCKIHRRSFLKNIFS